MFAYIHIRRALNRFNWFFLLAANVNYLFAEGRCERLLNEGSFLRITTFLIDSDDVTCLASSRNDDPMVSNAVG